MKLPWKANKKQITPDVVQLADAETGITLIAEVYGDKARERAAFIVRACNAHDALIADAEALGAAIEEGDPQDIADRWENLKTTIKKARGEA